MNKQLNKGIIVAGVIALLFIWVCLAFNNFDWAVLYAWILIGGGILVLVAVNVIILCAKNGENEMFEPKITKQEMTEFIKDRGLIMSWEDINAMKVAKEDIVSIETIRPRPVDSNEISKALEGLGYNVTGIDDHFVYFSDGNEKYSLYSAWNHGSQLNIMCLYLTYSINERQVAEFNRIASMITREILIARIRVTSNEDNTEYCLDFKADSFYTGKDSLNATILSLVDYIHNARSRFDELRRASEADAKTVDYTDVESNLMNEKPKYTC